MRLIVLIALALLQMPLPSVQGVATKAGTTDPVPHARVMLTKADGRLADTRVTETDERGRFAFRSVAPGSYRLVTQHTAFIRPAGQTITIVAGQLIRDLVVALTPTGVITGRVVDEYGDPVADVYVRAAMDASVFETTTNDLGDYRLYGLPPGAYVVSAAPYLAASIQREAVPPVGMQTGMSHLEWFRRGVGSIAISEVAARPPGAQITTLMSRANDFDALAAWTRLMIFDEFDPPVRRYAAGAAYLRGQGQGERIVAIHGLDQARHEIGDLVVDAKLPEIGQQASDHYEGEGFVILRHPETEVVKQALFRLISVVSVERG